jgi:hypothetical protein
MLALVLAALSVNAPVSSVTVYGDRARVVRSADVALTGSIRVELPLLPIKVDPGSIRLEAAGAEVRQVEHAEAIGRWSISRRSASTTRCWPPFAN